MICQMLSAPVAVCLVFFQCQDLRIERKVGKENFHLVKFEVIGEEIREKRNYGSIDTGSLTIETWMDGLAFFPNTPVGVNISITPNEKRETDQTPKDCSLVLTFLDVDGKQFGIVKKSLRKGASGRIEGAYTISRFDKDTRRFLFGTSGEYKMGIQVHLDKSVVKFQERRFKVIDRE